jgi:hypothetical protein
MHATKILATFQSLIFTYIIFLVLFVSPIRFNKQKKKKIKAYSKWNGSLGANDFKLKWSRKQLVFVCVCVWVEKPTAYVTLPIQQSELPNSEVKWKKSLRTNSDEKTRKLPTAKEESLSLSLSLTLH